MKGLTGLALIGGAVLAAGATDDDGLRVLWSPVNQAWFVMWHDQVLRVVNEKAEAEWLVAQYRRSGLVK